MHVRGSSHIVFHGRKLLCKKVVRGRKYYVKSCRDEVHFRVQKKFTFELKRSSHFLDSESLLELILAVKKFEFFFTKFTKILPEVHYGLARSPFCNMKLWCGFEVQFY